MRYFELLERRADYVLGILGKKIEQVFADEVDMSNAEGNSVAEKVINHITSYDPTPKHLYTQWLATLYANRKLKLEDLYKAKEYLELFHKVKTQLPKKDINQYKSLPELFAAIEPFGDYKSNKEIKKSEWEEIKKDIRVVYNGPEGKILIPTTEEASIVLGKGTQWCTAATKSNNYFDEYNSKGSLYVILPNDGRKFQFHLQSAQLMDERDKKVDYKEFAEAYPWVFSRIHFTNDEMKKAVKQNGYAIKYIKNPSEEVQKLAVQQNYYAIEYIKNPCEEVQILAVQQNGYAIQCIKTQSEEVQKLAVQKNGYAIRYIENPSEDVQKLAVQQDGRAIYYIKNPSEEIQKLAVQQNGNAIQFIKNPSEEVQRFAVQENGNAIRYIKNPSEEVQRFAVQENGNAIRYIKNPSIEIQKLARENQ